LKIFIYTRYFFRSVLFRGFLNTLRVLRAEASYDKKFGISTSTIKKSESAEFYHYQGAGYLALLTVLREAAARTASFHFVDIGCGKGRAVFAAEFCGYNQLRGIELDAELVEIANANLKSYRLKRKGSHIEFIHVNALGHAYANVPTVYFFFNPFSEAVMQNVLNRIAQATQSETWFIYMNPQYKTPFEKIGAESVKTFKTGKYTETSVFRLNARQ